MNDQPRTETVLAWACLFRSYKLLLEQVEANLKRADLPPLSWYDVLYELHEAPNSCMRQFELSEKVLLPKYNLSRLLDRLVRGGLVERKDCPEDKRGTMVNLTPIGRSLLRRMWKVYGRTIRTQFEERLTRAEVDGLSKTLRKLIQEARPIENSM